MCFDLEFALTELWGWRRGHLLTHAAYKEIGQVAGAITQQAETIFNSFTLEQQKTARRVFTRLVRVEEGRAVTRQRATLAELFLHPQSGEEAGVMTVMRVLTDARLLVVGRDEAAGEETVEIAHEALIRNWARLWSWLSENLEFLLWRQRLRANLADWECTGRDEGALLRGVSLAEAERWLAVAFSPDGQYLATASRNQVRVWEVSRRQEVARVKHGSDGEDFTIVKGVIASRPGEVHVVSFSPDGQYLATGSTDRTARVWEVNSGKEVTRMVHD